LGLERRPLGRLYDILLEEVAGGHSETLNGRGGKVRLSVKKAHPSEASTHPKVQQLNLFNLPGIIALLGGEDVKKDNF
jgi:hypothetical protein